MNVGINFLVFKTARAEVDDFDLRVQRVGQEDVLGFEIAVYHFVLFQKHQAVQKLLGKSSDDLQRKSAKGVRFDEFVKVHIQKFCRYAKMSAEIEALSEIDHTVLILRVLRTVRCAM